MLQRQVAIIIITFYVVSVIMFVGCSASEEGVKEQQQQNIPKQSATEIMTKAMADLKLQNDSLKSIAARLEQDNRAATAHAAELETQLNDLKTKLAAPAPVLPKPQYTDSRVMYENALRLFRSRNYEEAASSFQRVLETGTPSDLMDNCHYWLGECTYATKRYEEAIEHFEKVFTFKVSEKKDDAQIMIANSYYAMGHKARAKEEYQKFLEKFPASPYAKRAKERLGKL